MTRRIKENFAISLFPFKFSQVSFSIQRKNCYEEWIQILTSTVKIRVENGD